MKTSLLFKKISIFETALVGELQFKKSQLNMQLQFHFFCGIASSLLL